MRYNKEVCDRCLKDMHDVNVDQTVKLWKDWGIYSKRWTEENGLESVSESVSVALDWEQGEKYTKCKFILEHLVLGNQDES